MMPAADISLQFSWNPYLFAGAVVLAALIAALSYRHTIPPVGTILRSILTALRTLGLACLLLAIAEPVVSLITTTSRRPVAAVLIDQSQSMTMADRTGKRDEEVRSFLTAGPIRPPDADVEYFGFSSRTRSLSAFSPDSLRFTGNETDIASAIQELRKLRDERNIQSVVLISDGDATTGDNPVYDAGELGLPIISIGVGDSSEQKDVLVGDVIANSIGYVESAIPVDVTIKSTGYDGVRDDVTLSEGSAIIQKKTAALGPGGSSSALQFEITPKEEGVHKYTVRVAPLRGEMTERNNTRSFFVKILKSKISVVMIAGAPGPDVAFIRRILTLDRNITLKTFVQKSAAEFYEGVFSQRALDSADCILIVGYPMRDSSPAVLGMIRNTVEKSDKPLFYVASRTIDIDKLRILEPLLPFTPVSSSGGEREIVFTIVPSEAQNALFRFSYTSENEQDDPRHRIERWNALPPIFEGNGSYRARPESQVLARATVQGVTLNDPVLISRSVQQTKSLAFLGYGIWRWELLVRPASYHEAMLSSFISNAVRWLTTREDSRRVVIAPDRLLTGAGDPVKFAGQVYDENYSPIDNAEVSVTLYRGTDSSVSTLRDIGNGRYETSIDGLTEGDYSYKGTARVGDKTLGEDRGRLTVGGVNSEFLQTRMNAPLLRQLAARTGGKFTLIDNARSLLSDPAQYPAMTVKETRQARDLTLWNSSWLLIGTIVFFSIEWFLRKRSGMM